MSEPNPGKQAANQGKAPGATNETITSSKKSRLSSIAEKPPAKGIQREDKDEDTQEEDQDEDPSEILELLRAAPTQGKKSHAKPSQKRAREDEVPHDASEESIILEKAMAAQRSGDTERADMFFDILAELRTKKPKSTRPEHDLQLIPQKSTAMIGIKSTNPQIKEGGLSFYGKGVNSFRDMGLPMFFDKNMKELKGPLPLTIFNKKWQDAAILFHADKRSKSEDSSEAKDRYSGLKFQSEWEQSFSDWTINHRAFHLSLLNVYGFPTFAGWLLDHKDNCDRIQAKDGFMAALRYDIQLRTNAFAHRVVVNGDPSVPDISVLRTDIAEDCYAEARNFDELGFRDTNPYSPGGPRAHLDPLTCLPRPGKANFVKQPSQPNQHLGATGYGQYASGYPQGFHSSTPYHHGYNSFNPSQYPPNQAPFGNNYRQGQQQQDARGSGNKGGYKGKNFNPSYQDHRRGNQQPPNQGGGQMVLSSNSQSNR
ncbi:hypothetical protein PGT21_009598 [Puccinia graminis f. sp. tritici]|uniref:Uncharacterized protein n=1 Tax=Puccinia graminis f. sp. tritici TaxID=56615 RepID=A0A5B0LN24_PUCGR|nr:hypothetical protein PGT21_009598 [Puccinia graminis f. sp. tritici]